MAWKETRLPISITRLDCLATGWPRLMKPSAGGVTFRSGTITYPCKDEREGNNSCESVTEEKKIMLREFNSIAARRSSSHSRRQASVLRATCLLCRVLWPIVVQHRHLLFDSSSEANTLLLTPKRSPELSIPS